MQMRAFQPAPCSVRYRLTWYYTIPLSLQPRAALCLIERYEKDSAPEAEQARRENQTAGRSAATAFCLAHAAAYPLHGKGEVGKYERNEWFTRTFESQAGGDIIPLPWQLKTIPQINQSTGYLQ